MGLKIRLVLEVTTIVVGTVFLTILAMYGNHGSNGMTSVMTSVTTSVMTNVMTSGGFEFEMIPGENVFAYPGEENKHVMTLRFYSEEDPFRLRNMRFEIGGINVKGVSNIRIVGSDDRTYRGHISDGYVYFRNLYIKSDAGKDLTFDVYLDFSRDLKMSDRFYLRLNIPEDLDVTMYGDRVYPELAYPELAYPLASPHVSIVGNKILF